MTAPPLMSAAAGMAVANRRIQLAIRARLLVDVLRLWPLLNPARLTGTFPAWLAAMTAVTARYHAQSAQAAAVYYRAARQLHAGYDPDAPDPVRPAPPPSPEWMGRAYGYAGPGVLQRTADPRRAQLVVSTTAARIAADGGRATLIDSTRHDPAAVGWYRVTDGDPCYFCALLASRGVVYKTDRSAGFDPHNGCGCAPAPVFTRDVDLPDVNRDAARVYAESTRGERDKLNAFRRAWESRSGN